MKIIKLARKRDSNGRPLGYQSQYVLKKKRHGLDDPYFFGGSSLHSPQMVMDFDDALQIDGGRLQDLALDWERDWLAIEVRDNYEPEDYGPMPMGASNSVVKTSQQKPEYMIENGLLYDENGEEVFSVKELLRFNVPVFRNPKQANIFLTQLEQTTKKPWGRVTEEVPITFRTRDRFKDRQEEDLRMRQEENTQWQKGNV